MKATATNSAATEGWMFEIEHLTVYVLRERVSPTGRGYIVTIQEDVGEGVEIGEVQSISEVQPLLRGLKKIVENE